MNPKLKAIYKGLFDGRRDKSLNNYGLVSVSSEDIYFLYYFGSDANKNGDIFRGTILQDTIDSWSIKGA